MPQLGDQLELGRCPHCNVDKPSLPALMGFLYTTTHSGNHERCWRVYSCTRCGGVVTAGSDNPQFRISEVYPSSTNVDEAIPDRARIYLTQALNSLHAPAGSVMLSASAVDAMLKEKGYLEGSLYKRIDKAAEDHLVTQEMAKWAHEVRLDANDQRHADENAELPSEGDARKCVDFVLALAQFMFVLPARVQRGLEKAQS